MNLSFHSSLLHIGMISVAQGNNQSRQKIGYLHKFHKQTTNLVMRKKHFCRKTVLTSFLRGFLYVFLVDGSLL